MDVPRQQNRTWWRSHPSARAASYALLYSVATMSVAYPAATLLYDSIRESLRLPYGETTMLQLLPTESLFVYFYFLIFAYCAETLRSRR